MNYEQARYNMIEQQVRPWTVLDPQVLATIGRMPREHFVPADYRGLAYADTRIPIGHGQTMMPPVVEGRLLQALEIEGDEDILEIGTGSGYVTACLAHLGRHVESVEIHRDLSTAADQRLREQGIGNVNLVTGDAATGWPSEQVWDAIALTGSVPEIPQAYRDALAPGGRLFAIVGERDQPIMEALLITRVGTDEWSSESLFETWIAPLVNAERPPRFEF